MFSAGFIVLLCSERPFHFDKHFIRMRARTKGGSFDI